MKTTGRRFGAYHRVSQANGRDIEAESTMTDKVAWQRIDAWAVAAGVEIVERYLDWDKTGSKLERPQLDRVIADLKAGKIDGIAVARTDRFSRASVADALRLVGQIQEMKPGSLALLDLGVDPTTPTGELMLTLLLAIARMQWRQFKDTWATAQTRAVDRGVYVARAPFGYRHEGGLVPNENAPIVREAFRIGAGDGFRAAMKHLANAMPDKRWTTTEARRILSRRAYLGEARVGSLINRDAHEPLTTPELFAAVQALPEMTARPRKTNGKYPLSGLAVCGKCDGRLVGNLQTWRSEALDWDTVKKVRRYRCPRGCMTIDADPLEAFVQDRLGVALATVKAIRVKVDEGHGLAAARDSLDLVRGDLQRWATDDRTRDLIGDDAFYAGLEQRQATVNEAEGVLAEAAGKSARAQVIPAVTDLEDPEQFERALRAMVKAVLIAPARWRKDRDRATIEWTDDVLEVRGNQSPFETTASDHVVEDGRQALAEGLRQKNPGSEVD